MKKESIRLFTFIVLLSISISNNIAMERTLDAAEHRPMCNAAGASLPTALAGKKLATESLRTSLLGKLYAKREPVKLDPDQLKKIAEEAQSHNLRVLKHISSVQSIAWSHHISFVRSIAWSPDDTRLATTAQDCALVWDTTTGEKVKVLRHKARNWDGAWEYRAPDGQTLDASWNHDGTRLATKTNSYCMHIWDIQGDGQEYRLQSPSNNPLTFMEWSPDGTRIAINDCIVNTQTQAIQRDQYTNLRSQDLAWPFRAGWNHDSTQLAIAHTGLSEVKIVSIWDGSTSKRMYELRIPKGPQEGRKSITAVIWNHDDTKLLIACQDGTVGIWDTKTHTLVKTLKHAACVNSIDLSRDGIQLATASNDHTARIWDIKTGEQAHQLEHDSVVTQVIWNNDRSLLATSCEKVARIWNAKTGALLHVLPHDSRKTTNSHPIKIAWNRAGTRLATKTTGSIEVKIWDTAHLADPVFQDQHNKLKSGTLTPEQLMTIALCHEFRLKNPDGEASLKKVAAYAQTKGVTTAELARALLVLHPVIINGILKHFNVSAQREDLHQEYSYKALQEAQEYINASHETIKKEHDQNATPLATTQAIENTLKEYIVDTEENYLTAYKALEEAQHYLPFKATAPIKTALEEYIV